MRRRAGIDPAWGVTAVRVAMGISFTIAGWTKFAGGIGAVVGSFANYGIPLPGIAAPFIATLELVGGFALIVGLFSRWLALLFTCELIIGAFYVKLPATSWVASRIDIMLLGGAALLLLAAPGRLALDGLCEIHLGTVANLVAHTTAAGRAWLAGRRGE